MLGAPKASMKELVTSFTCEGVEPGGQMVKRFSDTGLKISEGDGAIILLLHSILL